MTNPRGKYATMLDPETWAYIDRVVECFPPELAERSVEEQRGVYNEMCRHFQMGRPVDVSTADIMLQASGRDIPVRRYSCSGVANDVTMLYFHGGGFVFGDLDSHDDICANICSAARIEVVSVDYRLAPEHVHPAAFDDAVAAFDWLAAQEMRIILAGESAGGSLAAAVARVRHGVSPVSGMVLIYPALGAPGDGGSYTEHAEAPLLAAKDVAVYAKLRAGGHPPSGDPTFYPLDDWSFSGLPPTRVVTAQCDPLADDGKLYVERIRIAGGQAQCREETRLTHSFLRSRSTVQRAREAFDAIVRDVVFFKFGRHDENEIYGTE